MDRIEAIQKANTEAELIPEVSSEGSLSPKPLPYCWLPPLDWVLLWDYTWLRQGWAMPDLLDVRDAVYTQIAHIPGAKMIPMGRLQTA